jgi:hypothetical protein
MFTKKKSYKILCQEREVILDERENYIRGIGINRKMGLFLNEKYSYFDELSYIIYLIDKEMKPYEILYKIQLYKKLKERIPIELLLYISSFGSNIDKIAVKYLEKNI